MTDTSYDLCVIGAGPGGVAAALKAQRLGAKVLVIEKSSLGGTCLNRGCIPTKVLLNSVAIASRAKADLSAEALAQAGGFEGKLKLKDLKAKKDKVVSTLRLGLSSLLSSKKINVLSSEAKLLDAETVSAGGGEFKPKKIILALGSRPREINEARFDKKEILSSDEALDLEEVPKSILIVGAGAIGCEFATIFNALGTKVYMVELLERVIPLEDKELSRNLEMHLKKKGISVFTKTKLEGVTKTPEGFVVNVSPSADINPSAKLRVEAEKILVGVGRLPNTDGIGLQESGVLIERGRVKADLFLKTSKDNIYAIGDCVGNYLLAHTASYEGQLAASNIFGEKEEANYKAVPSCVYTEPEVASVGLSEDKAKEKGIGYKVGKSHFRAIGKAHAISEIDGFAKVIFDISTDEILGAQMIGPHATELIATFGVAVRNKLKRSDLKRTIFAHPTLSEIIGESCEI